MNNTTTIKDDAGNTLHIYHQTTVVKVTPELDITLNSGGYRTATTKRRMNAFTETIPGFSGSVRVYQEKGQWFIESNDLTYQFYDGITFDKNGMFKGK